jgi:FtsX-like permease family
LAIRSAVGAQQKDIRKLLFGEGFRLIAAGVIAGVALAVILSRVLKSFLFEVQSGDPATLVVVGLLFLGSRSWRAGCPCGAPRRSIQWKRYGTSEVREGEDCGQEE